MRRTLVLVAGLVLAGSFIYAGAAELIDQDVPTAPRFVIAAAGDIACNEDPNGSSAPTVCQYDDTSHLITRLVWRPC